MRRLAIFFYFLFITTLSLRVGHVIPTLITIGIFAYFYQLAEKIDNEESLHQ